MAANTFQYSTAGAVAAGNNAWRNISPHGLLGFADPSPWLLTKLTDLPTVTDPRNANRKAAAYVDIASLALRMSTFDGEAAIPSLFQSFINLPHLNALFGHVETQWTTLGLTATDVSTEEFVELVREYILTGTPAAPMILDDNCFARTEVLPAGNTLTANGHDWILELLLSHCGVPGDPCDLAGRLVFWTGFYLSNIARSNPNGFFYRAADAIKAKAFSDNTGDDQLLDTSRHGYPVEVAEAIGEWFQRALPSTPKALLETDLGSLTTFSDLRMIRVFYLGTAAQKEREMALHFGDWIATCPSLIKVFDFHSKGVFSDRGVVPKYKELLKTYCPNATDPFDHGTTTALDSLLKDVVPILDVEAARVGDFKDAVQILIENRPMAFASTVSAFPGLAAGGGGSSSGGAAGNNSDDLSRPVSDYDKDFIRMVASVEFTAMALQLANKTSPIEKFQVAMAAVRSAPQTLLGVMQFLNSSMKQPRGHTAWKDLSSARDFGRDHAYGRAAAFADPINRDRMARRNEFRLSTDLDLQIAKCEWGKVPWADIAGPLLKSFISGQHNLKATDPALLFTTTESIDETGLVISEILAMWGLDESPQNSKSFLSFAASLKSFIRAAPTHFKSSYGKLAQKLVVYALELSGRYHLNLRNGPISMTWHNDFLISGVHDSLLSELTENQQVADMIPVLSRFVPGLAGKQGGLDKGVSLMVPPTGMIQPFHKGKKQGKKGSEAKKGERPDKQGAQKDSDDRATKTKSQLKREKFIKRILENAKEKGTPKAQRGSNDDTNSLTDSDNSAAPAIADEGDQPPRQMIQLQVPSVAGAAARVPDNLLSTGTSQLVPQQWMQPQWGQQGVSHQLNMRELGTVPTQSHSMGLGFPGIAGPTSMALPMFTQAASQGQWNLGQPLSLPAPACGGLRTPALLQSRGSGTAAPGNPLNSVVSIPRADVVEVSPSGVGGAVSQAPDLRSQIQMARQGRDTGSSLGQQHFQQPHLGRRS